MGERAMIERTSYEVEKKILELWESATNLKHRYDYAPHEVVLEVSSMYSPPGLSYDILTKLISFFGAKDINSDNFNEAGCDTCDYRSKYGFVLSIT